MNRCTRIVNAVVAGRRGLHQCGRPAIYWEHGWYARCAEHVPVDAITPDAADPE